MSQKTFGELLTEFMVRARLGDTALAERLRVERQTIYRLRKGVTKRPHRALITQLKDILNLDRGDMVQLEIAAGYLPDTANREAPDRVDSVDRCVVYSHSPSQRTFPTRWSLRLMEAEEAFAGDIYHMTDHLPALTRPPRFYDTSFYAGTHDKDLVDAYKQARSQHLETLQQRFIASAKKRYLLRYILDENAIEAYIKGESPHVRYRDVHKDVMREHMRTTIEWLEDGTIEIGLTTRRLPEIFRVIGYSLVFVEFHPMDAFLPKANLLGLEISGRDAVEQFLDQFDAVWRSSDTNKNGTRVKNWFEKRLPALE